MVDESRMPAWRSLHPTIRWGAYAWAFVGMALALVAVWRFAGYARIVVVPLSLALFPAAILGPVARWLERHRWPPALAALVVLSGFVAALAAIAVLVGMQLQGELAGLVDELRSSYERVRDLVASIPFVPEPGDVFDAIGQDSDGSGGDEGGSVAVEAATAVAEFATEFFLFLVASFFFIKDRRAIAGWVTGLLPVSYRGETEGLRRDMWETVGGYIRGQTVIALFDGMLVAIGLLIVGIPLAIVLGVVVFFGAFVPVVGSITAGAIAVVVALVSNGLVAAAITTGIIVGVQQIEGNVLAPVVLGREVDLHPLAILCAIVLGASVLGVWGAIIAVPLSASLYRVGGFLREDATTVSDVEG